MPFRRTGEWSKAREFFNGSGARMQQALQSGLRHEAERLRTEVVQGITRQAPGGRAFVPLSASTLARRRLGGFLGTKALMVAGDLRNAVTVVVRGDEAFVGVQRATRGADGRSLANVAEIQEFGAGPFVVPITDKMRRLLGALRAVSGSAPAAGGSSGHNGTGSRVIVVKIPPRPFLRPAFDAWKKGAERRFAQRVQLLMRWPQ
jgi:hypothetical protein